MSTGHPRVWTLLGALALTTLLGGCAETAGKSDAEFGVKAEDTANDAPETLTSLIRVDVLPSDVLRADGSFRVFPQTLGPLDVVGSDQVAVGTVELRAPVELFGNVQAEEITPVAAGAELPAVLSEIPATVRVRRPDTVQNYQTEADEAGSFTTLVVPNVEYEVQILPFDPEIPFLSYSFRPGTNPQGQDIEIGYGAAIFGRVLDGAGRGVEGTWVHAEDAAGLAGASVESDADGNYLLRVAPGEHTVVSTGRPFEPDPTLRSTLLRVEPDGVAHDVVYPRFDTSTVSGAIVGANGQPLEGVRVRFTAVGLQGYADIEASLVADDTTNSAGGFQRALPPGTYDIEVLPPVQEDARSDHTPLDLPEVIVDGPANLGSLALQPLTVVDGHVLDEDGDPVRNARVTCEESGFERRQWSTFSEGGGAWSLDLPAVQVDCTLVPPGDRLDLALTRQQLDASEPGVRDLRFRSGTLVRGAVQYAGEPERFAVVEVRDLGGALLGSALTDEEGAFQLYVNAL